MKLLTWPKHAIETGMSHYNRAGMVVLMALGIAASIVEILLHVLLIHSTSVLIIFWLGVVITGWLSDHYKGRGILVYTFGAWIPYVVFILFSLLTAVFH